MPKRNDKRPLESYLRVERDYDRRLNSMLRQAASDIDRDIKALAGRGNIGAVIRREQLMLVKRDILERLSGLMTEAGNLVEAGRLTAAAEAIKVVRLYDAEALLAAGLSQDFVDAYQDSAILTSKRSVAAAMQRLQGASYIPLAESVYRAEQWSAGQVDRFVNSALSRGLTWREFASGVRDMIRPDVPGGVSYAAQRLARTEINNAAHAVSKDEYRKNPIVEAVDWNLSGSHPVPDECNEYAEQSHYPGGEEGHFLPNDVPSKPHPNCLCYITPVTPSREEFIEKLFAGEYDDGDYGDGIFLDAKEELANRTAIAARRAAQGTPAAQAPAPGLNTVPQPPAAGFRPSSMSVADYDAEAIADKVDRYVVYNAAETGHEVKGDEALLEIWRQNGFAGKPRVVDKAEFDAIEGQVWHRSVRGDDVISSDEMLEQFMHGDEPFPGRGWAGNGTYAAADPDISSAFGDTMMELKIDPNARGITYRELYTSPELREFYQQLPSGTGRITDDLGRVASMLNYDYMLNDMDGVHPEIIILNRTAVIANRTTRKLP